MTTIRQVILVALTVGLSAQSAQGGAWTRKQGSLYTKLGVTVLGTSEAYDQDGNKFTTPKFNTWSLNLYGEYGATDRFTSILRAPVLRAAKFENSESFTGVGDISVEFKYGLIRGSTPVSVSVEPVFPSGDKDGITPLTDGSGGTVRLPTGDGEYNTVVKGSVSHSFHPIPGYVSFDAGYNFRTMGFTDEYLLMVQAGYQIDDVLWLQGNINAKGPVATPDSALASRATLGFGEGVQFVAYSFGLAYEMLPTVALTFDAYSAFGKITSIYSGFNFVFGISWQTGN
ncbi:MAG: hypothetical protein OEV30_00720 [Ignavibacteria bacterium]|nr:hypothetical protein [Ignavibacteria bacterium]